MIVLISVIASIAGAVAMFVIATVDALELFKHLLEYFKPGLDETVRVKMRTASVVHIVEIIDGYLLGTIMIIFGFGLYELFISKIDIAEGTELGTRVLLIRNLDDLKDRLAKVVILILVVKFFEHAIQMDVKDAKDLVMLAAGVSLLAVALYVSHYAGSRKLGSSGH